MLGRFLPSLEKLWIYSQDFLGMKWIIEDERSVHQFEGNLPLIYLWSHHDAESTDAGATDGARLLFLYWRFQRELGNSGRESQRNTPHDSVQPKPAEGLW